MSANLPNLRALEFATNVQLLLQQEGSRLSSAVMMDSHVGKSASPVDQMGSVEMQTPAGRFAPIGRVDASLTRRWAFPADFDLPQLADSFDELQVLSDPKSKYVQNALYAAGRKRDAVILAALLGTSYTGEQGGTSVALPAAQKVAIGFGGSGNTKLTVAKLREGVRILRKGLVNPDETIHMAIGADEHDSLLAEVQVTSADFNGGQPVLKNGKIDMFMGVQFILTELVQVTSSVSYLPMWVKSGAHLGNWGNLYTDVSQRKDLSGHPWQAYIKMTIGATRLEEAKVVQVACDRA
jgi:hypothetical protein